MLMLMAMTSTRAKQLYHNITTADWTSKCRRLAAIASSLESESEEMDATNTIMEQYLVQFERNLTPLRRRLAFAQWRQKAQGFRNWVWSHLAKAALDHFGVVLDRSKPETFPELFLGNWSGGPAMKGMRAYTPGLRLRKVIRELGFRVTIIDEAYTSVTCALCLQRNAMIKFQPKLSAYTLCC